MTRNPRRPGRLPPKSPPRTRLRPRPGRAYRPAPLTHEQLYQAQQRAKAQIEQAPPFGQLTMQTGAVVKDGGLVMQEE